MVVEVLFLLSLRVAGENTTFCFPNSAPGPLVVSSCRTSALTVATIVATVNADVLQDDTTNGPGAEFGKQKVVFSPATLNDNKNNTSTTIHCQLPKACTINYAPSCS